MYTQYQGKLYNITKLLTIPTANNYGANSTVNYIGIKFPDLSVVSSLFETINVYPNDFLLIKMVLPESSEWYDETNLLNFTPYFFEYTNENGTTQIFASIDKTIHIFDKTKLVPNSVINICCTSSIVHANYFSKKGYIIS